MPSLRVALSLLALALPFGLGVPMPDSSKPHQLPMLRIGPMAEHDCKGGKIILDSHYQLPLDATIGSTCHDPPYKFNSVVFDVAGGKDHEKYGKCKIEFWKDHQCKGKPNWTRKDANDKKINHEHPLCVDVDDAQSFRATCSK